MSDESRVLLDMATLDAADDMPVSARKLREVAKYIEDIELENMRLDRRVIDLEAGSCRYNCRTKSYMWKEGCKWGFVMAHNTRGPMTDLDKQYDKWGKRNG